MTVSQVLSHAPDTGTAGRAESVAVTHKWVILEKNEELIWGRCKGSGSTTYKTAIILAGPHFHCSCPARVKPCKHLLGLWLLAVREPGQFSTSGHLPEWVTNWANKKKKVAKPVAVNILDDPKREKRLQNRLARLELMSVGAADLEVWLMDLVRQGLASVEEQDYNFWQDLSARMVDTQLSALGPRIRNLQLLPTTRSDWPDAMLREIGELYLVTGGFSKLDTLPDALKEQLIRIGGIKDRKADLLIQEGIRDEWGVVGSFEAVNIDNVAYRRVWLLGRHAKQYALLLDFSFNNMGYEQHWRTGHIYEGELVYYPGSYPLRALLKEADPTGEHLTALKGSTGIENFLEKYAEALSANPWLAGFPCCLQEMIPVMERSGVVEQLILVDQEKKVIPLLVNEEVSWKLLALSGGRTLTVFGEWTGRALVPLGVVVDSGSVDGRYVDL